MNFKYLLIVLTFFNLINYSQASKNDISQENLCDISNCNQDPNCKCWCSVKCGPRDKEPGDCPFRVQVPGENLETKLCFCKQRDYDLYISNKCAAQRNQEIIVEVPNAFEYEEFEDAL